MKGMIVKDFLNLKSTLARLIPILILWMAIFIPQRNTSFFGIVIMMLTMMVVTTISYDDLAKWDGYALTLPVSRKEVVTGKYLMMLILDGMGIFLAFLIGLVGAMTNTANFNEMLMVILIVAMIGLIFGSTMLPLIYHFGTEKARLIIILVALIPTAVFILIAGAVTDQQIAWISGITANINLLVAGIVASFFTAFYVFLSYKISVRLYEKKEF